ncbi:excalibur calcium-binding domain-containing protein [Rhodococcus sp. NM-2]|uniref:excalibur calcium-binding domain-containing protein n=1 Tax=Rhodococcus sp. NM-2 TaxID=3401174 RepID=UPI003AB03426
MTRPRDDDFFPVIDDGVEDLGVPRARLRVGHGSHEHTSVITYKKLYATRHTSAVQGDDRCSPTTSTTRFSFASCAEAKAAGAAPIYQGEPGYSTKLDRDKDGIACDK